MIVASFQFYFMDTPIVKAEAITRTGLQHAHARTRARARAIRNTHTHARTTHIRIYTYIHIQMHMIQVLRDDNMTNF